MHPSDDESLSAQQPPGRWHVDIGAWMASASRADKDALAIEVPGWAASDDLRRLFDHRSDLLLHGDVVWGSVIQANNNLLDPKAPLYFAGAPGEVVYDPQGGVAPEVLDEVARRVYASRARYSTMNHAPSSQGTWPTNRPVCSASTRRPALRRVR